MTSGVETINDANIAAMDPVRAQSALDGLLADEAWTKRLMAGDKNVTREFQALGDRIHGTATAPVAVPSTPDGPVGAQRRLDALMADQAKDRSGRTWAQRVEQGEVDTTKEFQALTTLVANATDGDWAIGGYLPDNHLDSFTSMPRRDLVRAGADLMRSHEPSAVKDLFDGPPPTPAQRIVGKQMLAEKMRDPVWMDAVSRAVRGSPGGDLEALAEWNSGAWALGG